MSVLCRIPLKPRNLADLRDFGKKGTFKQNNIIFFKKGAVMNKIVAVFVLFAVLTVSVGCGQFIKNISNSLEDTPQPPPPKSTFTDLRDGKSYNSIKIGSRTWMAENLSLEGNDKYDWHDAMKVCPSGWHLPSERAWRDIMSISNISEYGFSSFDSWWTSTDKPGGFAFNWSGKNSNNVTQDRKYSVRCVQD